MPGFISCFTRLINFLQGLNTKALKASGAVAFELFQWFKLTIYQAITRVSLGGRSTIRNAARYGPGQGHAAAVGGPSMKVC